MEEGQYPHLVNNRTAPIEGMLAMAVPTRWNLYARAEQYFPHFLGSGPEHLSSQAQDLISRQEQQEKTSKPWAASITEMLPLGGGGCPRSSCGNPSIPEALLMSQRGFSFQHIVIPCSGNQVRLEVSYLFFPRGKAPNFIWATQKSPSTRRSIRCVEVPVATKIFPWQINNLKKKKRIIWSHSLLHVCHTQLLQWQKIWRGK